MAIRLSVGVAQKIGQPRYGSYGAHCALEVELSLTELASLDRLQGRIRQGLDVCRAAVAAELERARGAAAVPEAPAGAVAGRRPAHRPATLAQLRAVHAIVRRRRLDLYRALEERFEGRGLDELTLAETSRLIDALQTDDAGQPTQA